METRALFRLLAAHYLKVNTDAIELRENAHGKPYLINHELFFNISHSHERAVIAYCISAEIGIDIQYHKPAKNHLDIVERFFTPEEIAQITKAPASEQASIFYELWALKEAFIKATGSGLQFPLNEFSVDTNQQRINQLIRFNKQYTANRNWALQSLKTPAPDYAQAIAWDSTKHSTLAIHQYHVDKFSTFN